MSCTCHNVTCSCTCTHHDDNVKIMLMCHMTMLHTTCHAHLMHISCTPHDDDMPCLTWEVNDMALGYWCYGLTKRGTLSDQPQWIDDTRRTRADGAQNNGLVTQCAPNVTYTMVWGHWLTKRYIYNGLGASSGQNGHWVTKRYIDNGLGTWSDQTLVWGELPTSFSIPELKFRDGTVPSRNLNSWKETDTHIKKKRKSKNLGKERGGSFLPGIQIPGRKRPDRDKNEKKTNSKQKSIFFLKVPRTPPFFLNLQDKTWFW